MGNNKCEVKVETLQYKFSVSSLGHKVEKENESQGRRRWEERHSWKVVDTLFDREFQNVPPA